MSRPPLTEEEAKILFAKQVNGLAEHARIHGPDPDCARKMAKIIARNEAECFEMEREAQRDAAEEDADDRAASA